MQSDITYRQKPPQNRLYSFFQRTNRDKITLFARRNKVFPPKSFVTLRKKSTFALAKAKRLGAIAQLVEQRTENPCVPGSIPGGTTAKKKHNKTKRLGAIAQLVEQRTENPCVPGSIPGGTTAKKKRQIVKQFAI